MKKSLISLVLAISASVATAAGTLRLDAVPVGEIDPAKAKDYADSVSVFNVYDALLADKPGGGFGPSLATDWKIDGTIYTFTLRDDVTFSSGNKMTADDVVFSMNRMLELGQGYSYLFSKIDSITSIDANTVQFKLKEPFAPFLMALKRAWVVDSKTVQVNGKGWLSQNSAGSGAYVITSHNPQNLTILKKRNGYWGKKNAKAPDTVRFSYGLEAATVRASIQKGTHDLSSQWLPPEVLKALDKSGKVKMAKEYSGGQLYIKMNAQRAPFDDIHCRRAMVTVFDYATAIKMIAINDAISMGGKANGTLPAGLMGYDSNMSAFSQNIESAKAHLAKCKYKASDLDIELSWMAEVPLEERFALLLQSNLKSIGVKSHVKKVPWTLFQDLSTKPETTPHVTQIFVVSNTGDPDALLYQQYHSSAKGGWAGTGWLYSDDMDAMLDAARSEGNVAKRTQLYKDINKKVVDTAPAIFAYDMVALMALSNRVTWPALEDRSKAYTTGAYNIRFIDAEINE